MQLAVQKKCRSANNVESILSKIHIKRAHKACQDRTLITEDTLCSFVLFPEDLCQAIYESAAHYLWNLLSIDAQKLVLIS